MANRKNQEAAQPTAKILCMPFDFGIKAKAAELARRMQAECLQSIAAAEASANQPKASKASRGQRSGSKRASIKREWLASLENWNSKPAALLLKLNSLGIESTESSIASIRSDLRACMLAIEPQQFSEPFQAYLAGTKGLRSNDPLAYLNQALWSNPSLERKAAIELLKNAGFTVRDDFIGGSLAASKESIAILAEMGAFTKAIAA